jgi:nitrogen regulatory protein P-II 1
MVNLDEICQSPNGSKSAKRATDILTKQLRLSVTVLTQRQVRLSVLSCDRYRIMHFLFGNVVAPGSVGSAVAGRREVSYMKLIRAIIRPNKLEEVMDALTALNVSGMTVTEVRGHGRQKGHKEFYRGAEYNVTLLSKVMIDLVLPDDRVDETLAEIMKVARTGTIGDGRIFVLPVIDGYNIRTGERDAIRDTITV